MTLLAVVGAVVITAALIFITFWFLGLLFMQAGFAGLRILSWKEWVWIAVIVLGLVSFWYLWWAGIGSHIAIGFE